MDEALCGAAIERPLCNFRLDLRVGLELVRIPTDHANLGLLPILPGFLNICLSGPAMRQAANWIELTRVPLKRSVRSKRFQL